MCTFAGGDWTEIPLATLASFEKLLDDVLSGTIDPRDSIQMRFTQLSKQPATKTHGGVQVVKFELVAYYTHPGDMTAPQAEKEALAGYAATDMASDMASCGMTCLTDRLDHDPRAAWEALAGRLVWSSAAMRLMCWPRSRPKAAASPGRLP